MNSIIGQFNAYLASHKNCSPSSITAYNYDLVVFLRFIRYRLEDNYKRSSIESLSINDMDNNLLKQVTPELIDDFFNYLKKDRENKILARGRKHSTLKEFFHFLTYYAYILDEDPMASSVSPKGESVKDVNTLSITNAKRLLKSISGIHEERDRAILTIFLTCGLRLSELCGLLRINDLGDFLLVNGRYPRSLPINKLCREALDAYLPSRDKHMNSQGSGHLFITDKKTGIKPRTVHDIVRKHLDQANLDSSLYTAESLRQTCTMLLIEQGEDLDTLKDFLGFATTKPLDRYLKKNEKNKFKNHPLDCDDE